MNPSARTRRQEQPLHTLHLDVPTDAAFLQVIRVTAATAASQTIDDLDRLDDLRLAVDELAVALIQSAPPPTRLRLQIELDEAHVTIRGETDADGDVPTLSEVGTLLVQAVADSYRLAREGACLLFEVTLLARPR